MQIETKYNLEDKVWCLSGDKVYQLAIIKIEITIRKDNTWIMYELIEKPNYPGRFYMSSVNEKFCFSTKEELLASL